MIELSKEYYLVDKKIEEVNEETNAKYDAKTKKVSLSKITLKDFLGCLDFFNYIICNQKNEVLYDVKDNYDFIQIKNIEKYFNCVVITVVQMKDRLKMFIEVCDE